jgi:hypothetical protein
LKLCALVFSIISALTCVSHAATDSVDRLKQTNRADYTHCADPKKQRLAERTRSKALRNSLIKYLNVRLTDNDRQRRITGAIAAVSTDKNQSTFIFYIDPPLATRPGDASRFEHRQRLNSLVTQWRVHTNQDPKQEFFIRFDDECEVPVAGWK